MLFWKALKQGRKKSFFAEAQFNRIETIEETTCAISELALKHYSIPLKCFEILVEI